MIHRVIFQTYMKSNPLKKLLNFNFTSQLSKVEKALWITCTKQAFFYIYHHLERYKSIQLKASTVNDSNYLNYSQVKFGITALFLFLKQLIGVTWLPFMLYFLMWACWSQLQEVVGSISRPVKPWTSKLLCAGSN